MNTDQQLGYDLAKGASLALGKIFCIVAVALRILMTITQYFGEGMDDSDQDTWHRSDLRVLRDAKTGIEYLSDGHGGLVTRGINKQIAEQPNNE